ncbi:MAG: stalk domain-containing protein [Bacillota bacterium]|nr:stalk domain-containing protein [Bacillota bacterium]
MKLNYRLQGFVAGLLVMMIAFGGGLYAKTAFEKIEVKYDNIEVYKDNSLQVMKDAQGNVLEPFIYQGTTYVPVRAAAEMAGLKVEWDGAKKRINFWDKESKETAYLVDVCPPFAGNNYRLFAKKNEKFMMGSKEYMKGIELEYLSLFGQGNVYFNLNGEYSEITMMMGPTSSKAGHLTDVEILLDDKVVKEIKFKDGDLPQMVVLPVKGALKLEIKGTATGEYSKGLSIGIGDIKVK